MPKTTLADRLYDTPTGGQFHAIIAAILGRDPKTTAKFVGKASVTSDGFVMCSFVDPDGWHHHGAFVCAYSDLDRNIGGLKDHLDLTTAERVELDRLLLDWIDTDYRRYG